MELKDLAELVTAQGEGWEEFKRTNEQLLEAKASGDSVAELENKLSLINTDLDEIRVKMTDLTAATQRPDAEEGATEDQKAYAEAFGNFLRKGDDQGLRELERKAMQTGSDPDGGYLVLPEMDSAIDRIAPTISAMNRLADTITIGSAKYEKLVKTSGMSMRRVADGATGGETTNPKYSKVEIEVHTAEVEPWVFNETLEDAFIDLEADLAEEAAIGFAEGSGSEFITGDGVGKARGITAYTTVANASYSWGNVGYIASGAAAGFAASNPADQVVDLQHALKAQYRPGAVFLTNDATLGVMRQFKDSSGTYYLWNPDPLAGFGGRFLGNPVEVDDNMPDIGAGALGLAFGNFKRGYKIVNRSGVSLIRDNITSKGQTKFNFRKRFGGGIVNFEAIKLLKFATS